MPTPTTVEVSTGGKNGVAVRKASFTYGMPSSISEAAAAYTEEKTLGMIHEHLTRQVQAVARKCLEKLPTQEDYAPGVQEAINGWVYGERAQRAPRTKTSMVAELLQKWHTYSPEEQQSILAAFTAGRHMVETPPAEEEDDKVGENFNTEAPSTEAPSTEESSIITQPVQSTERRRR